jgi:tRNA modification GTPase
MLKNNDTICAIATSSGAGAISVIRLSGPQSISICNSFFYGRDLENVKSHTLHFGTIRNHKQIIDEVVVSVFKNPHSYTGEDVIEVSCHGSIYIQNQILQLFTSNGARIANPGEFTLRAFSNGKMDLSQAEAVADLIASESEAAHKVAMHQMRGGFSNELQDLRAELIEFASLIELELDFGEEDVEFADRKKFNQLLEKIKLVLKRLIDSFAVGNVMKNGIPVAIIGQPNVGKSTLLNTFLNEERAIVSNIAGTTRDTIEDVISIGGIQFRFIDTAGIRETKDVIESIGINKAIEKAKSAMITIFIIDASQELNNQLKELENLKAKGIESPITLVNKVDLNPAITSQIENALFISAKNKEGIEAICNKILDLANTSNVSNDQTLVSNNRHLQALHLSLENVLKTIKGLNSGISGDFLAMDIRQALYHIGEITGEISTDDLLDNIFSNFCIGK